MPDSQHNALPPEYRVQWYQIEKVLGQGGFGITYLASDTNLAQKVAIKEYLPHDFAFRDEDTKVRPLSTDTAEHFAWGLERFIAEAQTLARFDHPNIVRVHTVFEANGTAYMIMRFEQGRALSDMLRDPGLPEAQLVDIALRLIDGLEQVHAAGFIHRDIKPANIYIRADGSPVLLDFGSARQALSSHTRTLTAMVSPGYAPYEQYMSDAAHQGPWTDIYALGATLYRAACGKAPASAIDRSKPLLQGIGDLLVPAADLGAEHYSPGFLAAIDHAMAFNEADRPQTLDAWRRELSGEAVPPAVTTIPQPVPDIDAEAETLVVDDTGGRADLLPPSRSPWHMVLLTLIIAFIVGGGAVLVALRALQDEPAGSESATVVADISPAPSVVVQPLPGSPSPPRPTAEATGRTARVEAMLREAERHTSAMRLTTPPGSNAFETYQAVLALDPDNSDANAGIKRIAVRYLELARDAAQRRDWPELKALLSKARKVDPDNPKLERVITRLRHLNEQRAAGGNRHGEPGRGVAP